jgi:serine/threonine-protein kinase
MIGKRFGPWVIEKELGRGGMGSVFLGWRAEDASPEIPPAAAIKTLNPELANERGFLQRFQREIEALHLLDHPNIVRFYTSGLEDGRYYYAMEYVPGRNFDELLQERGRLPWTETLEMALQVVPALKHAHDHGIIHRDLKPQNLMRDERGVVKLADFGVARMFASRQLTAAGGMVGTAEYISPEQAAGKPATPRSDLYSFGVVLYGW